MTGAWPVAGSSPVAVVRAVAGAYRALALAADPAGCAALDERMTDDGQGWVVVWTRQFESAKWLTARQAADLACVEVARIAELRRRGILKGRPVGARYEYRTSDVVAAFASERSARVKRERAAAEIGQVIAGELG